MAGDGGGLKKGRDLPLLTGDELFGYYECEKGIEHAAKVQAESDVVKRWDESMKGILIMEKDPVTGAQPLLEQVFWLE